MKNLLKLSLLFFFLLLSGLNNLIQAQCTCKPTTKNNKQERSTAKHETNFANFKQRKDTLSVSTIALWDKKYKTSTDTLGSNPASKRTHRTPEDTLYVLKGFLWFVKQESNDCDFHMEIGKQDINSTRIIVEVPEENCDLQKKIQDKMSSLNLKMKKHFSTGIPCIITGLGFYDASHRTDGKHGDSHTNKNIWELHPVKDLVFL